MRTEIIDDLYSERRKLTSKRRLDGVTDDETVMLSEIERAIDVWEGDEELTTRNVIVFLLGALAGADVKNFGTRTKQIVYVPPRRCYNGEDDR